MNFVFAGGPRSIPGALMPMFPEPFPESRFSIHSPIQSDYDTYAWLQYCDH